MKHFALLVAGLVTLLAAAEKVVSLPKAYQDSFVEYLSLDRVQNHDQFIRLFANDIAMEGRNDTNGLKAGSVLVAEVYSVLKNEDGSVKKSMIGRRIKDQLVLLAVMEKQEGYSAKSKSPFRTGDWRFAAYKPNGEVASKKLDTCRACHAPLTTTDYLFSFEHFPERK